MPHSYTWLCNAAGPSSYWCKAFAPDQFAEWVQVGLAFLGLLGLVAGFALTRRTLRHMADQTEAMRDQLALTDRAWLSVEMDIAGPFVAGTGLWLLPLKFTLQNHGRRVATNIKFDAEIVAGEPTGHLDNIQVRAQRALIQRQLKQKQGLHDYVVFPDARVPEEVDVLLKDEDARAVTGLPTVEHGTAVFPVVVGSVSYEYEASLRPHSTRFGFALAHHDSAVLNLEELAVLEPKAILIKPFLFLSGAD